MREIVFDTETTGLDPLKGDRLVEIGCVELVNHLPTGQTYHVYINPERSMPAEAFRVHGLSDEFLADKPVFSAVVDEFEAFIGDAMLIAHNATFDINFINAEFARLGKPPVAPARVIDTLVLARRKHPMGPNSLDALCARYGIDTAKRTVHGGLVDSELLAEVYLELIGGRQPDLVLVTDEAVAAAEAEFTAAAALVVPRSVLLPPRVTDAERAAHGQFIAKMGESALWRSYAAEGAE
ncbi:DNA polymerase III subunit epsilon [Kaistia dalseonensis]|uniref:DNA polymerase III subunit epsilon n=1 Tax=Kaistia dalseonensis TaxID=410840 RepID=A0ABU0H6M2_9HYPH|nr:DNA polymerase III subunit epsilon [Kaistia dalseonensis]MCX5494844.1 DNA polymerase III subunit epsilon [Kaistia dalseonensis]MDQ0437425.1 DNA polymerase-3 subunit epsilon [Kaistia dalseonensis]